MIKAFKDPYKVTLMLATLFFVGIAVSAFFLYQLPSNLMIPYGYEGTFNTVYIIVALTFAVGILVISQAIRYKKELVVFRERTEEMKQAEMEATESKNAITTEGVKNAIKSAKGEKDVFHNGLEAICKEVGAGQGAAYRIQQEENKKFVELFAGYALSVTEGSATRYAFGEGLIGQSAANGQPLYLDEVPEGYIKIISGLGSASPRNVLIVPVKNQSEVVGVLEIATFSAISNEQRKFIEQSAQLIVEKLSAK